MARYTKEGNGENNNHKKQDRDDRDRQPHPLGPVINMISRGPTTAEMSKSSRKAYAREVLLAVGGPSKKARTEAVISFDDTNSEGVKFPHDDPLVIIPVIRNASVKRVFVDGATSVDILFHEAFIKMGYNGSQLTPSDMPVCGFNRVETKVEGINQLSMTMG